MTPTDKNHALTNSYYPKLNTLVIGANFMPLKNYGVDRVLMSDSVGFLLQVVSNFPYRPTQPSVVPSYVIYDFPNSSITDR